MINVKDALHVELKRAFSEICRKKDIRREYINEEDLAEEITPWLEKQLKWAANDEPDIKLSITDHPQPRLLDDLIEELKTGGND
jgi:hypothetical protein